MAKHIITAALPYANGSIHIGHLLEYIQADIYARFLKLMKHDALYICASDMHGTPIEVNAKKAGLHPEQFVEKYWKEHQEDFTSFLIQFDNFYKTHSPENQELAEYFFSRLKEEELIYTKEIEQMYDKEAQRFLPDRFVKGTCPKCKAEDQYSDNCEKCGSHYSATELIEPYSTITNTKPVLKKSTHYFFKLSKFSDKLQEWVNTSNIQEEIKNWLTNWIKEGLKDWCISRDAPYFGFPIPNAEEEVGAQKFFYVWLDAPIGYISSTKNYCDQNNCNWKDYWYKGNVHHFIGKDIVYFHYLFWIGMFMGMGIPLPELTTHGFVNVNGKKMSKSRGTYFTAKEFRGLFHPEALRFYYASHLDRKVTDVDLNFGEFQAVVNNVFMGNIGNFCYRTLTFAHKNYEEVKPVKDEETEKEISVLIHEIQKHYETQEFRNAVKSILKIADLSNAYFQKAEPWAGKENKMEQVGFCVNLARNLSILMKPIAPEFSSKVEKALGEKDLTWDDLSFTWSGKVGKPELLVEKIEKLPEPNQFPLQMKVGRIKSVSDHPNADSLYLLKVSFREETKQVVAGLKDHFTIEQLEGQLAVFCVNMKPAKLRGELSEAMVLVADDKKNLSLLKTDAEIGTIVEFEGLTSGSEEVTYDDFKKIKMIVQENNVFFSDKMLVCNGKPVEVSGVEDKARIY